MRKAVIFTVISALAMYSTEASNILCLFTSISPSHNIIHMAVADSLIERGHNLTIVTTLPVKSSYPGNFTHIHLANAKDRMDRLEIIMKRFTEPMGPLEDFKLKSSNLAEMTNLQYEAIRNQKTQDLLATSTFDLVIIGYFFNDFQLAVAAQAKAPIVLSWMVPPISMINSRIGMANEPSYVPHAMIGTGKHEGFLGRLKAYVTNSLFYGLELFGDYKFAQYYDEYVKDFNLKDMPTYSEVTKNVSLVLCNSHFTEAPIRPNVPGLIEIGGIQIKDKPHPLDKQLQTILDSSSEHGAILFSMGSNVKVSTLDPKIITTLFNVLSKVKQTVLWKWENNDPKSFPGKAKNILFRKWIPQDDVLAHKNMKLFITHGGKGSVIESVYHGVPMIGLPVFGDQPTNVDKMVSQGYGLKVDYNVMTEKELNDVVQEVITNPMYSKKVKSFSQLYKDRPMTARQSVGYWVEYVIRHHGAKHMQSPLVHMNVIQQYNLDVIALIVFVLYVIFKLFKFVACSIICKIRNSCRNKSKKD